MVQRGRQARAAGRVGLREMISYQFNSYVRSYDKGKRSFSLGWRTNYPGLIDIFMGRVGTAHESSAETGAGSPIEPWAMPTLPRELSS